MKFTKKLLCIILAVSVIFTALGISAYADEPTTSGEQTSEVIEPKTVSEPDTEETTKDKEKQKQKAEKSLADQRRDLEKMKKENEDKLKQFSDDAKITEEYIDALDEQIGYLNQELDLLDREVAEGKKKVEALNAQIKPLEKEMKSLQKLYDEAVVKYAELKKSFETTYDAYCMRMRALYISGESSVIAVLFTCNDISDFFNRLEMIRTVAKSDSELLQEVDEKMNAIVNEQDGLNARKTQLEVSKSALNKKKTALEKEQATVASKQAEMASKKVELAEKRATSDKLFAEYTQKVMLYTEFRNEDEEVIKKVDAEIDALLKGLKDPEEVTTAENPEHNPEDVSGEYSGDGELFANSNAALSLGYPVPGYYGVSAPFGHYSNGKPHTGTDFPCPTGSKVVAAQKGIVITVKRLNYSYGYYVMIYHGTDAQGRKIVTLYAHNSSILVSVGQSVAKGQQIAKSGSTGNSTGPHCHFELIIDGVKVNSKNYLS